MFPILEQTSRTFYIPITRLPDGLRQAVSSAYLCFRAIDEIEDHRDFTAKTKAYLLREVAAWLTAQKPGVLDYRTIELLFRPYENQLPPVTRRIAEWCSYSPPELSARVWDVTASMAERMAFWADSNWQIATEKDLDRYTFAVAGAVGLYLCELWEHFEALHIERGAALNFGRGLQLVNIVTNRADDLSRGIDFFPAGVRSEQIGALAHSYLSAFEGYFNALPPSSFVQFASIPLALAQATLRVFNTRATKLKRQEVLELLSTLEGAKGQRAAIT